MILKALDLFCGGGGACIGLQQAGFDVTGIDINPHLNYPGTFIQADIHNLPVNPMDFDFVWASPPCQAFSIGNLTSIEKQKRHPDLIPITRKILSDHQFTCIENVKRAPIRSDVTLSGASVGLNNIIRMRKFETSFFMMSPPCSQSCSGELVTITSSLGAQSHFYRRKAKGLPGCLSLNEAKEAMGIPIDYEMTRHEIGESVPPPYSKYIADEVMRRIREVI